jgi:hypothetical protein
VESFGAEEYWRCLGMVQNGDGKIEGMLEAVEAEVREEAAVLGRKRITVILPRVLYKLKFSHANVKQIDRIHSSLLDVAAKKQGRIDCGGAQSSVWRTHGMRVEKMVG